MVDQNRAGAHAKVCKVKFAVVFGGTVSLCLVLLTKFAAGFSTDGPHWIPCATIDCKVATTLKNSPLQMLKARQNVPGISQIQNYHALSNRVASDMTQIYFDVPKIVHQVWLGETPPPLAWVDSWR